MKKVIIYLLISCALLAQEEKKEKQGIELPDFVITGLQSVTMPEMAKIKPPFVTTLSKEFFNPAFSPEEFTLGSISQPDIIKAENEENVTPNNGKVKIGAGIYSLPEGLLHFSETFGNFMLSTQLWGGNEKAHVDNSARNYSGGKINSEVFVSNNSPFIPGLRVGLNAFYARENYKFYGSPLSDTERKKSNTQFGVFLANHKDSNIKFRADAGMDIFSLPSEGNGTTFTDQLVTAGGSVDLFLSAFSVRNEVNYVLQSIDGAYNGNDGKNYFSLNSLLYYRPTLNFSLSAGIFLSGTSGNSLLGPVVNLKLKMTDQLSLLGSYATSSEYFTTRDFIEKNRFIDIKNTPDHVYETRTGNIKAAVDFEYNKFFEVIAGFDYSVNDNHWYYTDLDSDGKFEVNTVDDYKRSLMFLQTNFHLGPLGIFYGEANYFIYKVQGNTRLPYEPEYKVSGVYGYEVFPGFIAELRAKINGPVYADLSESKELAHVLLVSTGIKYLYFSGFSIYADLENIFNRKDEYYYNYQEKPLDIKAGLEYRW